MKKTVFYEHIEEASMQMGLPLARVLEQVKLSGIDGVEIEDRRLHQQSELPEQLRRAGLMIGCIYGFLNYKEDCNRKNGRGLVELANSLNVHNILVIPGFVEPKLLESSQKTNYQREVCLMIEYVRDIVAYAGKYGITVGMEDFDDKVAPFSTIQGLKEFAQAISELKVTFDTGNFLYSEEDVIKAFNELQPYIGYVHMKDRSFSKKPEEEPKATVRKRRMYSSPVGSGVIPMKDILILLKRSGYDGTLAIEHFGSRNQLGDIRKSSEWISENWEEERE